MFKTKINYLKQTLIYASGNFIKNLFFFVLIPLFTFKFTPSEYAVYSILSIFMSFMNLIYLLGMQESLYSYFNHEKSNSFHLTFISSVYITLILSASVFSLLIYDFNGLLSILLFKTDKYAHIISVVALILWFNSFFSITQSFLNIIEKSTSYMINKFVFLTALVFFYFYGYVSNTFTLDNVFKWLLYTAMITFVSSTYYILRNIYKLAKGSDKISLFSVKIIKDCIKFGLPMVPGSLSLLIMSLSDRYLISRLAHNGLHEAGIYAISYKIGLMISFLTSLFSLAYLPYAMKIAKKRYAKTIYQRFFNLYLILGALLSVGIILFSPEIFKIFINKSYFSGMKIVFFGTISNFLIGIFYLINIAFYNIKKSKYIAVTITFGAILNIVLNVLTIPRYGIYGAGFSSILSYLVIVLIHFYNAKRQYDLGYNFGYMMLAIFSVLLVSFLNYILPISYAIAMIKFVVYMAIFVYIGFYKRVFHKAIGWMKQ